MKKSINLYFNEPEGIYYFNDEEKECDNCGNKISKVIVIRVFWDKLKSGVNYLCYNCKSKISMSSKASFTETYIAVVKKEVPSRAIIIPFVKPSLSNSSNLTTLDVAGFNLDNEKVVDKTVYANRPSKPVIEYVIERERNDIDLHIGFKPLKDSDLEKFFIGVKNSQQLVVRDNNEA